MPPPAHGDLPFAALVPFLLLTFVLAWGLLAVFLLFQEHLARVFGPISARHPLFILAVYAPAIAAFTVVAAHAGLAGLRRFLSRLLLYRTTPGWYAFVLLGIPLAYAGGALLKGSKLMDLLALPEAGALLATMAFMLVLGPVEEFGWRGVALPLLQRRLKPARAGLALGLVWGVWHLPAFFLGGTPQSQWGFLPFLAGAVAVSVIVTAMFNASRGSILLAALFHFQLNNPLWPDGQPHDAIIFAVAAGAVLWCNRGAMFSRAGAVTVVVPRPALVTAAS